MSSIELATRLESEYSPADVFYTLSLLESQGVLTQALPVTTPGHARTCERATGSPATLEVSLLVLGVLDAGACREALERAGVRHAAGAPLTLVLTDSYLRPEIAEIDAMMRARATTTWLPVRLAHDTIWMGPLFGTSGGPCCRCLMHRLSQNRPFEYHLLRKRCGMRLLGSVTPFGALDADMMVIAAACADALGRPGESDLLRGIVEVNRCTGGWRLHRAVHRPQCGICGDEHAYSRIAEAPVVLRKGCSSAPCSEAMLRRLEALVDPLTGAIQSTERATVESSDPVHVWTARFGTVPEWGPGSLQSRGLRQSAGKGATDEAARASCLGEAIERASWARHGDEPRRLASYDELGQDAIHPNACMLFSEAQYASRGEAGRSRWDVVPPSLDSRARIEWTPVWSLGTGSRRYFPTALLYGQYPAGIEPACCVSDPSGNGAGVSLEDAVLRGTLELIERDALAIWWYNRIRRPAIALDVSDASVGALVRNHAARGRAIWALDLTTDLGVPVVAAVSRQVEGDSEAILLGFGADLDGHVALSRAMLELAQIDVQIRAAREEGRALERTLATWLNGAKLADQPWLEPAPVLPITVPSHETGDAYDDITRCRHAIEAAGMDLLVLDLTRPDFDVPVARVIAPGLRHFRRRLAPGRLYDVPVRLGWLDRPHAETELNPIPFFL